MPSASRWHDQAPVGAECFPPASRASLAAVAVQLLTTGLDYRRSRWLAREGARIPMQLDDGARRAITLGLAGIYQLGLTQLGITAHGSGRALHDGLARARRLEIADDLASCREARAVLSALVAGGVRPVVLKGRPLAERLWPEPWMRPSGDLDLLVEEDKLGDALAVLTRLRYRPAEGEAPGCWRPTVSVVEMSRGGSSVHVEVHTRLFRTVGGRIVSRDLLSRAVPSSLLGLPIRALEPADEVLFLLVHAAKHGALHPKWLLDLHAARLAYPRDVWNDAAERAIAYQATRPFWAAARCVGRGRALPAEIERRVRPSLLARTVIARLVSVSENGPAASRAPWRRYAREWLLEDRLPLRVTRLIGVVERVLVASLASRIAPCATPLTAGELRSQRWLGVALSGRQSGAHWVTLRGASMAPSVLPGDRLLVIAVRSGETLRKGDLLIAWRAGRLVAHRVIRRLGEAVVTRGDGAAADDSPIPVQDILAKVIVIHHAEGDA